MRERRLWYVLGVSLLFNIIFFLVDILPALRHYYHQRAISEMNISSSAVWIESEVVKEALEMASTSSAVMPMSEPTHFIGGLMRMGKFQNQRKHERYNYPKAFLFAGLSEYAMVHRDTALMDEIAELFEPFLEDEGVPSFEFTIVDQVPFGMTALHLYQFYGEMKYKKLADYFYQQVLQISKQHPHRLVAYRPHHLYKIYFNDTLGMICPFLIRYGAIFSDPYAWELARIQLNYFTDAGTDKETHLPAHAISQPHDIKVGPHNWGRGIGWYLFALAEYLKYVEDDHFREKSVGLYSTLKLLKTEESLWSQFPGSSGQFDASATLMIMYSINLLQPQYYGHSDIFHLLSPYVRKGRIASTSGDTYGVNRYSGTFGDSELSQGFLLLLLSTSQ
jgi:unsaturated rhamnogalacturonyl hydrolase